MSRKTVTNSIAFEFYFAGGYAYSLFGLGVG
jgi:hypothetical protein